MTGVLTAIDLKRHEKVLANIDLPGVPIATRGKVLQKTGLTWIRYRVLFDNGVEHGLLDGRHVVRAKDFVPLDERAALEVEPSANGAAAEEGATDEAASEAADNSSGVPAHLLERSQRARERLTAAG